MYCLYWTYVAFYQQWPIEGYKPELRAIKLGGGMGGCATHGHLRQGRRPLVVMSASETWRGEP